MKKNFIKVVKGAKNKKLGTRIISFLLLLIFTFSAIPAIVYAEAGAALKNIDFSSDSDFDGEATIPDFEAPIYEVLGENVELTLLGSVVVPSIRILVKQLSEKGVRIEVDELIILNYLLRHREITAQTASEICQRSVRKISETLNSMDVDNHILTAAGKGKGRYYVLSNEIHKLLAEDVQYSRNEQAEEAALKAQILTLLKKQALF